jgi:inner membrane protein
LTWNGRQTEFLPGTGGLADIGEGLHAPVGAGPQDSGFKFSFPLSVNGSESVYTVPFAEETVVQFRSNSPYPNFQGNWLPTERRVSDNGFDATWRISYLGRNYPQSWISGTDVKRAIDNSRFGVEIRDPIDQYRMADRSVKYAGLFILLTFASIWIVEVMAKSPVHPVQYLMMGAAMCVFYLLELSLSEHVPFSIAYGIASLAIVVMIAAYGKTIFRRGQRSVVVPMGVTLLYSYLYVLLTNEDAALLVGSIGLFAILAVIMFITRGVNWYAPGTTPATTPES